MIPKKNNLNLISTLYYVWGALNIASTAISGIFLLIFGYGFIIRYAMNNFFFLGSLLSIIATYSLFFSFISGLLKILCGYYLRQGKNRVFCIVVSALTCFNIPLGTILGIFTIIEVEKPEVKELFNKYK